MKFTGGGENQVVNIAQGKANYYICYETLTKSCILSYKWSGNTLGVLLYFTLKEVLIKYNALSTHLLNKNGFLW